MTKLNIFRSILPALMVLGISSPLVGQQFRDPFLKHRERRSDHRVTHAIARSSTGTPPVGTYGLKPPNVDSQLSQIERQTLRVQPAPARRNAAVASSMLAKQKGAPTTNSPMNFQYHQPRGSTTNQPASAGPKVGTPHRIR